jgi:hypothetical protein
MFLSCFFEELATVCILAMTDQIDIPVALVCRLRLCRRFESAQLMEAAS